MKHPQHLTFADVLGTTTGLAAVSFDLKLALEIALLFVSLSAMAPLAFWRLRALWRDLRGKGDSDHAQRR